MRWDNNHLLSRKYRTALTPHVTWIGLPSIEVPPEDEDRVTALLAKLHCTPVFHDPDELYHHDQVRGMSSPPCVPQYAHRDVTCRAVTHVWGLAGVWLRDGCCTRASARTPCGMCCTMWWECTVELPLVGRNRRCKHWCVAVVSDK